MIIEMNLETAISVAIIALTFAFGMICGKIISNRDIKRFINKKRNTQRPRRIIR